MFEFQLKLQVFVMELQRLNWVEEPQKHKLIEGHFKEEWDKILKLGWKRLVKDYKNTFDQ